MGKEQGGIGGRFLWARLGIAYVTVTFTHILCAILLVLPGCGGAKMRSVAEHLLPRNSSPLWKVSMSLWRPTNCLGQEERARQLPAPVCPQACKAGLSLVSSPIPSLLCVMDATFPGRPASPLVAILDPCEDTLRYRCHGALRSLLHLDLL